MVPEKRSHLAARAQVTGLPHGPSPGGAERTIFLPRRIPDFAEVGSPCANKSRVYYVAEGNEEEAAALRHAFKT